MDGDQVGLTAVYINDATLERWGMKTGTRVTDIVPYKKLRKDTVLNEIAKQPNHDLAEVADQIKAYEGEFLLLLRGPENEFETNYLWCNTVDSYEDHIAELDQAKADGDEDGRGDGDGDDDMDDLVSPTNGKRANKSSQGGRDKDDWFEQKGDAIVGAKKVVEHKELSTQDEVNLLHVKSTRPLLGFYISQPRFKFGKHMDFDDIEPTEKNPEYRRQKIPNYNVERATLDFGWQAAAEQKDTATQTFWLNSVNKATQYVPSTLSDEERLSILDSQACRDFLESAIIRCKRELQTNETIDLFKDEFLEFMDEEVSLGNRAENNLEVFHSFHHLRYSKSKHITSIQWHPTKPHVAFACSNNMSFDVWVEQSGKVLTSSILIYNMQDLLHPHLVLEVPGNLHCFRLNPHNPDLIAGGLMTGQVIFWDLTDARARLQQHQQLMALNQQAQVTKNKGGTDAGEDVSIPPIKPTMVSYIDRSHSRPVTDLVWLPTSHQINKRGEIGVGDKSVSSQFMTVAADGKLLFWDFRNKNDRSAISAGSSKDDADSKEPRWSPIYQLPMTRPDNTGTVAATKISLGEGTHAVCVTEDGEFVHLDWGARLTDDKTKIDLISSITPGHFTSCMTVERSPHFPDIFLTVADWTFSIWKIGITQPVFTSACSTDYLSTGRWSPTRPGIIMTARADGTIDVWDLLDQCHKASLNFPTGFADGITSLEFWQSRVQSQQYLAAGDVGGKLHVIDIPRNLRRKLAHEEQLMRSFYDREIQRAAYTRSRAEAQRQLNHASHVAAHHQANSLASAIAQASQVNPTEKVSIGKKGVTMSLTSMETEEKENGTFDSPLVRDLHARVAMNTAHHMADEKRRSVDEDSNEKEYQKMLAAFEEQLRKGVETTTTEK